MPYKDKLLCENLIKQTLIILAAVLIAQILYSFGGKTFLYFLYAFGGISNSVNIFTNSFITTGGVLILRNFTVSFLSLFTVCFLLYRFFGSKWILIATGSGYFLLSLIKGLFGLQNIFISVDTPIFLRNPNKLLNFFKINHFIFIFYCYFYHSLAR